MSDIEVKSQFVVDMTIERLQHIQNAAKLAQTKALPGQELTVEVASGICFRFRPDESPQQMIRPYIRPSDNP